MDRVTAPTFLFYQRRWRRVRGSLFSLFVLLVAGFVACGGSGGGGSAGDTGRILALTESTVTHPAGDGEIDVDPLRRGRRLQADRVPVIFIHGFHFPLSGASPRQQMDDLIADLTTRVPAWDDHYQEWLYQYDPLNHLDRSAAELAGELHRVHYQGPVILVGYSQGGLVARSFDTQFGQEYPVLLLVMVATPNGGLPLEAMKGMLLEDINRLPDPLPTALTREVARVVYRELFGEREVSRDLAAGSPFLASLAPPRPAYHAFAGVGSEANLFLDYVSNLDLYDGLANDGLVTVDSVEAGLVAGRTAELRPGEGYLNRSHIAIIRDATLFEAIAELLAPAAVSVLDEDLLRY
jgi:pimeloyl-ACP methyl ester carboxylesterase